jgi:hypothetical protein
MNKGNQNANELNAAKYDQCGGQYGQLEIIKI